MANQFLALSLFIMLLSFFLMLNGLSSFDEVKSRPVLNSLSVAFTQESLEDQDVQPEEQDLAQSFREGNTLTRLEALFRSQITGTDIKKNRLGTTMHIRMKLEDFEKGIMMPGQREFQAFQQSGGSGRLGGRMIGGFFLPTLVTLLQSEDSITHKMDMVLNVEGNPSRLQNESPKRLAQKVDKAASLAKKLEDSGLPKKLMTAGVGPGPKDTVDLYFYRYVPFNPLGKKSGE